MKKFLSVVAACLTAGALFVGCGDSPPTDQSTDQKSQSVAIGMIAGLNAGEQRFNDSLHSIGVFLPNQYVVYYDSLNAMQMGLEAGNVDEISLYESVADYLIARKPELVLTDAHKPKLKLIDNFCCAVKDDDKALLDDINGAIASMKDDGTLERLTKQYIDDVKDEPEAVEIAAIDGADTIKVAVTGDMPPLDLIRADGTPAGFNTAILAEIGKRLNRNIELVTIDSAARASALSSGRVDVIFWVRVPKVVDRVPFDYDRPEGVAISDQYFEDDVVHVAKK